MFDRRELLTGLASLPLAGSAAFAQSNRAPAGRLQTRPIAGIGPVTTVGIGTSQIYSNPQGEEALVPLRATLKRFAELGGQVIDTANNYGRAEEVVGQLVADLGIRNRLLFATKVGARSKEDGLAQIEGSFKKLRTDRIDIFAVHNLNDVDNNLASLRDYKAKGKVRAIGITTSSDGQYTAFEEVMRRHQLDTIQVDYAIDNRNAAERILPLAQEKNIAPMINLPFGRNRLFQKTAGKPLPDWAKEIDATSWAQVFLKYILSHPSRPIVIPGTGQVNYAEDNNAAARGRMPDAAMRKRMEAFIDAL
jgi:aryl-alcohol dehydrogenase-like predicted oxidoreductase